MAAGDKFAGLLATSEAAMVEALAAALHGAGEIVQKEAQISITTDSVSGKNHVPSKPGQPPNNDLGTLANGIEVTQPEPLRVEITSTAPYSAALEYGTSKMAARPFMGAAAWVSRPEIEKALGDAVSIAVRKHFGK